MVLVAFAVSGAGFSQSPAVVDVAGLAQRISVTAGWLWLTLLGLRAANVPERAGPETG